MNLTHFKAVEDKLEQNKQDLIGLVNTILKDYMNKL